MHRTTVTWKTLGGLALALLIGGTGLTAARAQDNPPATAGRTNALIVPINATQKLQMSSKKPIAKVVNPKDIVARVQAVIGDPTSVLITGQEAGITRITLTDRDGLEESVDVVVQQDIEYLKSLIRRSTPTAVVDPIPGPANTIILNGTLSRAEDADPILAAARAVSGGQVVNNMRVAGVQQVELCVTVAQVSRSQFRAMTFDFLGNTRHTFFGSTIGQAVVNPTFTTTGGTGVGVIQNAVLGLPNGSPTNLFFGVLHNGWGLLTFFQALKEEAVVKTLAEPKLVGISGRPASFLSGGEQAVPVPAGLGQVGVQFEEFGTRLNFLPLVLGGGKIRLEVEPEVSALNSAFGTNIQGTVVPGRTTQRVHTTVEMEDGQTLVIGGLIQHDLTGTISKVPVLGDLPFVGAAFSSKSFNETETELIVLVTPHLIDPMACDQVNKMLPGAETRSPDDFELFLENILEAPRGQREIDFPHGYQAAYKSGPSAGKFPCGVNGGNGRCGAGGNCNGGCATGPADATTAPLAVTPAAPPAAAMNSQPLPSTTAVPAADEASKPVPTDNATGGVPPAARPTILPPASGSLGGPNGQ